MKLDQRSLPSGFELTSENPRVIRLTQGKMSEVNFGVKAPRVVELVVTDNVVEANGTVIRAEFADELQQLIEVLSEVPSVLTLIEEGNVVEGQLELIQQRVEAMWKAAGHDQEIMITLQHAK